MTAELEEQPKHGSETVHLNRSRPDDVGAGGGPGPDRRIIAAGKNDSNKRAGDRVSRERSRVRCSGALVTRLSGRRSRIRRRRASVGEGRASRICRVPSRLWTHTLPGSKGATYGGAGGHRS